MNVPQVNVAPAGSDGRAADRASVEPANDMARVLRDRIAPSAALAAGAIGLVIVVDWIVGPSVLATWGDGPRMKASTGVSVTLVAASLLLGRRLRGSPVHWVPGLLSLVVLLVSAASLAQYVFGVDLWIDQLIDRELGPSLGTQIPGRMAIQTSIALIALALASLWIDRGRAVVAQVLGLVAGVIGVLGLLGYAYGAQPFIGLGSPNAISLPASVALALFSVAVLAARVDEGITRQLVEPTARGELARRLLPIMVIIPTLGTWLRLAGERAGLYDAAAGSALAATATLAILGMAGIWTISRIAKVDQARSAAERERDRFFELSEDLLCTVDAAGRFVFVSPSFERILGLPAGETIGRPFMDFVLPNDRESTLAELRRQEQGALVTSMFRNRYGSPSGGYRWLEWNSWPDRETGLLYAAGRDVTERVDSENEIRMLNAELEHRVAERTAALEAANHELEAFSYSVSHDLRAPLRSIDGFSKILLTDHASQLDPEARRVLDVVARNARRMGTLIDDLLAFSRVARRDVELRLVDMGTLARGALDAIRAAEPDRDVAVSIGALDCVVGDPVLLGQVWANLLGNAVKFTRPVERPRIEVCSERVDGEVVFTVRDNGVGFDARYLDKLFKPFSRLHAATEFEGTGIGLAIVDRIVRRHGGRVWAESIPGAGATFRFALPEEAKKW